MTEQTGNFNHDRFLRLTADVDDLIRDGKRNSDILVSISETSLEFVKRQRRFLQIAEPVFITKKRVVEPITTPEMLEETEQETKPKRGVGRPRATDGKEHDVATLYSSGVPITIIASLFGSRISIIKDVLTERGVL